VKALTFNGVKTIQFQSFAEPVLLEATDAIMKMRADVRDKGAEGKTKGIKRFPLL
jgi:hypothetical protein